ncbi:Crp/Fnr family transcriptional regulator [Phenylobacterium sp.]|uniref:Crp/Fnr family transcriptional regulator n=1 Tax=Phenylobacterium sp. TaxID=1871053 RepID=UPI0035B0A99C
MAWDNHFLDSLAEAEIAVLRPHLAEARLSRNDVLEEAGQTVADVYLPIDCILSIVTVMRDGSQVESRTIGRESGYGLLHALGSPVSYERMIVQVGGRAWRIPLERLRDAARSRPELVRCIVQHAQATIVQSAQSTACNSLHAAEQRLARWLLMTQDRLESDLLPLTQEHMSIMLGVQRTTVTAIASELQARGLISYTRGKVTVCDRPGLERTSCECYAAIRNGVEAMLKPRS